MQNREIKSIDWQNIVDLINDSVILLNIEGRILKCNRTFQKFIGLPEEKIIGEFCYKLLYNLDNFVNTCPIKQVLATKKRAESKAFLKGRFFKFILDPILNECNEVAYFFHMILDITENKKKEDELKLFRKLIDSAKDFIEIVDIETGRFLDVNESACKYHGYTREEYLSLTVYDIDPMVDRRKFETISSQIREVGELTWEGMHKRKDGSLFPVEVSLRYVNIGKEMLIAVVRDITEQKKKEQALREIKEKYRTLIMNIPGMIYIGRPDWTGEVISESQILCGYDPEEFNTGQVSWLHVIHPEDRNRFIEESSILAKIPISIVQEYRIIAKDGSVRWVSDYKTSIFENGKFIGVNGIVIDINEKKRLEIELQRSEERHRYISELVSDYAYSFRVEPNGDMWGEWLTDSFVKVFGYTIPEIDTRGGWKSIVYAEDLPKAIEHAMKVITGKADICELRFVTKDGEVRWIIDYAVPVWDKKENRVVRIYGASQDITKKKRAEIALQEREEWFRTLADSTATAIFIYQGEYFTYVNKASCDITGYSEDELLKMRLWDIVHPDYLDLLRERWLKRQRGENVPNRYEFMIICKNGKVKWIDFTSGSITWKGKTAFIGTAFDVTERKIVEERLKESQYFLSEAQRIAQIGSWKYEIETGSITWSDETYRIYGVTPESFDINPKTFFQLIHPNDRALVQKWIDDCVAGKKHREVEFKVALPDGNIKILKSYGDLIVNKDGKKLIIGTVQDITEYRRLEEQLRQAQKLDSIGTFAGGIAHDFNNVLNAIMGYAGLLSMQIKDDDYIKHYVEQIMAASQKGAAITQQILAFSRKQLLNIKQENLNDILKNIEKILRRVVREDIDMVFEYCNKDLIVAVDSIQIDQVIMNLVANARDAMSEGGKITIKTDLLKMDESIIKQKGFGKEGDYAVLSVCDTGVGMTEDVKSKIFEPFFTTKEVGKGTGLGLSVVYGIIKQHKGYIEVESQVGKGSTFSIYLPIERGEIVKKDEEKIHHKLSGGKETILIAEDDETLREFFYTLLSKFGYKIILAQDGEEAVQKFKAHCNEISLVVIDGIMPKKNGKEVYKEICSIKQPIKALFISGYAEDIFTKDGIPLGNEAFIQKPIKPDELIKNIRKILDS